MAKLYENSVSIDKLPEKNLEISSKLVKPVRPYIIEDPNNKKAEEKAPKTKYFNPASVENSEVRFKLTKTQKIRL